MEVQACLGSIPADHASRGVDDVSPTWISRWTLLDLFLVFILALAVGKLWGPWPGAVAMVTFGLIFLEDGAPRWIWLLVFVFEGLVRLLPEGRFLLESKLL